MIQHVNTSELIDESETHYRFHMTIMESDFPQVHDFYELSLTTAGKIEVTVGQTVLIQERGALQLICPGIVHAKRNLGGGQYINLAFPRKTVHDLFSYLGLESELQWLLLQQSPLCTQINGSETAHLVEQMQALSMLPRNQPRQIRAALRRLLLNCMVSWFIPMTHVSENNSIPNWLKNLLKKLKDPVNLSGGIAFMLDESGVTPEHLCRTFRKYLGFTPQAYLNDQRLNYAANLLKHSDHSIIDIVYECGFQSESTFYHNFSRRYGVSPLKYRNME